MCTRHTLALNSSEIILCIVWHQQHQKIYYSLIGEAIGHYKNLCKYSVILEVFFVIHLY